MEVTTVSPSLASLTEGDDLCETDGPNMAIHSVTLLICLCGLAGNGAVLWLLSSHYFSRNSTTLSILILTFFDFLFLLLLVPSSLLFLLEDMSCSALMPMQYVRSVFWLSLMSCSLGLYLLTFISIERCKSVHCLLWHCCHHLQHLSKVVCALFWSFSITVFTLFATVMFLCLSQLPGYCQVSLISMCAFNLLLCALFMLISSTILFNMVKSGSNQQQPKSLYIVFCLSVFFTLPFSLWKLLQEFGYIILSLQGAFLLTCIHNSVKPFMYFLVGSSWRPCSLGCLQLSLQRIFEEKKENPAWIDDPAMDSVL